MSSLHTYIAGLDALIAKAPEEDLPRLKLKKAEALSQLEGLAKPVKNIAEGEDLDLKRPEKEKVEVKCDLCDKVCNSNAGLTSHKRVAHVKQEESI